jgi:hypothetical protein
MIPFKYTGQHSLVFDIGTLHPDDEFELTEDRVEAFRYRPDMECLDADAIEALDAATQAAADLAKPQAETAAETPTETPAPTPPIVTRGSKATDPNAKSDDSGETASKQE